MHTGKRFIQILIAFVIGAFIFVYCLVPNLPFFIGIIPPISGRVVDPITNQPIQDIDVTLSASSSYGWGNHKMLRFEHCRTNEDGYFHFFWSFALVGLFDKYEGHWISINWPLGSYSINHETNTALWYSINGQTFETDYTGGQILELRSSSGPSIMAMDIQHLSGTGLSSKVNIKYFPVSVYFFPPNEAGDWSQKGLFFAPTTNIKVPLIQVLENSDKCELISRGNWRQECRQLNGHIMPFKKINAANNFQMVSDYNPVSIINRGIDNGNRGKVFQATVDFNQAIDELNSALADTYYARGLANHNQGNLTSALLDFSKAIAIHPNDPWSYPERGIIYGMQGHFTKAIADFNRVIEIAPVYDDYYNLGVVHYKQGDLAQAVIDFNNAIKIVPSFSYAIRALEVVHKAELGNASHDDLEFLDRPQQTHWQEGVDFNPGDLLNQGVAYINYGNQSQAISDFNEAISEINADLAWDYYERGIANKDKMGNCSYAIDDFNKAIEINPNLPDAYIKRGFCFNILSNQTQALADFNKVIEIDPKSIDAYNNRGLIYYKQGNLDQAMSDFNKAIELNPNHAISYENRAYIYFEKKEYDKAWEDMNKAESGDASYNEDLFFLEKLRRASGRNQ